jgi:hypothetical protein
MDQSCLCARSSVPGRVAGLIFIVLILFFSSLYVFGHGKDVSAMWGGIAACLAIVYVHARIDSDHK